MESLELANMAAHGGVRKELARSLIHLQTRLDALARVAGADLIQPKQLLERVDALKGAARYLDVIARGMQENLTNRDVLGDVGSEECGVAPAEVYSAKPHIPSALAELERRIAALKEELPGITFGYIGNLTSQHDDRYWHIFLPHPGRVGGPGDSVGVGRTEELPFAIQRWNALEALARTGYSDTTRNGRY